MLDEINEILWNIPDAIVDLTGTRLKIDREISVWTLNGYAVISDISYIGTSMCGEWVLY